MALTRVSLAWRGHGPTLHTCVTDTAQTRHHTRVPREPWHWGNWEHWARSTGLRALQRLAALDLGHCSDWEHWGGHWAGISLSSPPCSLLAPSFLGLGHAWMPQVHWIPSDPGDTPALPSIPSHPWLLSPSRGPEGLRCLCWGVRLGAAGRWVPAVGRWGSELWVRGSRGVPVAGPGVATRRCFGGAESRP